MSEEIVPATSGIYMILNAATGKCYIGSAVNLRDRLHNHRTKLKQGVHHSVKLQNSWNKHGDAAFSCTVLEFVEHRECLIEREQYWIDALAAAGKMGYNVAPVAGSILGSKRPASAVEKVAEFHRGRKRSLETRAKIGAATKARSPEVLLRIAAALTGKKRSAETNAKFIGRKASPETRIKMSIAHTGKKRSAETNAKFLGRKASDEHRAKISAGMVRAWAKKKARIADKGPRLVAPAPVVPAGG